MSKMPITSLAILLLVLTVSIGSGAEALYTANIDPDGIQRVDVLAGSYFFRPDHIVVKANIPLEIKIRKEAGLVPHNFVIDAPEAGLEIKEVIDKEPKLIRIIPGKPGKYLFYCDRKLLFFESHRKRGMAGVLEVVE